MDSTTILLVVGGLVALGIFVIPIVVAFRKNHVYKWIILALTLTSPILFGVTWLIALIWVLLPQNKTILDPLVSSGDGKSNFGDTASQIVNNFQQGSGTSSGLEKRLAEIERLFQSGALNEEERQSLRQKAIDKGY